VSRAAKIKSMLRHMVVQLLDKIDPPPPVPQRHCPSCTKVLTDRALVECGDVDYCVCVECGEASVWKGLLLIAGEDSVLLPEGDD
jgi:hypothetical protein